jgi:hypothetical protein
MLQLFKNEGRLLEKNKKFAKTQFQFFSPMKVNFFFIKGSFSERSEKIGRGFIKILEAGQFDLSFNIIRHVFFRFGQQILGILENIWSC